VSAAENVIELRVPHDELVRVAAGNYSATYVRHVGMTVFRTAKLRVDFRLLAHPDLIVSRWYRVQDYRGGRIQAVRHGDLVRELSAVLGRRVRRDRIPVGDLKNVIVRAEVRDVIEDRKQDVLADVNRYSVISRLVEREQ
jgi:hypothetical protein